MLIIFISTVALLLAVFQNCGNVKFDTSSDRIGSQGDFVSHTFARTKMNTPVEFAANGDRTFSNLSATAQSATPENGTLRIIDQKRLILKYEPSFGFRGRQEFTVTVRDSYSASLDLKVTVDVDSSINSIQPALAVRGIGCIQCHSTVASNIISDFGFGGNGKGKDYFFGNGSFSWRSGNPYGDHDSRLNEILMAPDKSFVVPKDAVLPTAAQTDTGVSTLNAYVEKELRESLSVDTKRVTVVQKSRIFIGAPTETEITSSLNLKAAQRFVFYRNDNESPVLAGLVDEGTFFTHAQQLTCDGDLALRGPLLLENLRIETKTGCRIYVIGSVFISGPIEYIGSSAKRNIQITASKAISMGLGETKLAGAFCNPSDSLARSNLSNSLNDRFVNFWTTPASFVRQSDDPVAFGKTVLTEANLIQAKHGPLLDATCTAQGRTVSFEKILLNAPIIHSRYSGNVNGSIISEYALMSLGALFKFQFDPVFNEVNILPFLNPKTYLSVDE